MILIADSGSTKTDWCLIDSNGEKKTIQTIGINPYQMNSNAIKEVLDKELYPYIYPDKVKEIFYYGAGCSTVRKCQTIDNVLHDFFSLASIEVHHDLLGAARALCGHEPGIACILGTGSNSCCFDGKEITESAVSLGYLLGDEGSGANMGKQLLADYFQGLIPSELIESFNEKFKPTVETILDALYNQPRPNRFLASFSPFILENIHHPYMKNLVMNCFDAFFRINVSKYKNYQATKVNFLGSVAFYFRDILLESAEKAGITTDKIYRSAIEGLIDFHSN
jgi:N-acetylglucosamine kinase-like BadF-type ATPase